MGNTPISWFAATSYTRLLFLKQFLVFVLLFFSLNYAGCQPHIECRFRRLIKCSINRKKIQNLKNKFEKIVTEIAVARVKPFECATRIDK